MDLMFLPLRRYFDFRGRSRRKEMWLWFLFVFLVSLVLSFIDTALGFGGSQSASSALTPTAAQVSAATRGGVLSSIFVLAVLIPNISVQVRRLHDLGRTGWWVLGPLGFYLVGVLVMFTAFAGGGGASFAAGGLFMVAGLIFGIVLLVWFCLPGEKGPNRFGPDPLGPADAELHEVFR